MKMKILSLLMVFCLAVQGQAVDSRFRAYAKPPIDLGGSPIFPYRTAHSDACYQDMNNCKGVDVIQVGELDGNTVGPFAGKDNVQVLKHWFALVDYQADLPSRKFKYGLTDGIVDFIWTLAAIPVGGLADITGWWDYGTPRYVSASIAAAEGNGLNALYDALGIPSNLRSKENVLFTQIEVEKTRLRQLIMNYAEANNTTELVFEIGNEPNIYPYMSPSLYAMYFLRWRWEIIDALDGVNIERRLAGKPYLRGKMMPAGMWIFEGLPGPVKDILKLVRVNTDTRDYYTKFLAEFGNDAKYGEWTRQQRPFESFMEMHYAKQGYLTMCAMLGCSAYSEPKQAIDIGNLHFYPYISKHSSYGEGLLQPHFNNLTSLSDYVGLNARDGKVWLTELGNINPFTDAKAANDVVVPIGNYLKGGTAPKISRWYWFMAQGGDSKFDETMDVLFTRNPVFGFDFNSATKDVLQYLGFPAGGSQTGYTFPPSQGLVTGDARSLTQIGYRYALAAGYEVVPMGKGYRIKKDGKAYFVGTNPTTAVISMLLGN